MAKAGTPVRRVTAGGLWRALVPVLTQADCAIVNKWLGWAGHRHQGAASYFHNQIFARLAFSLLDASFHIPTLLIWDFNFKGGKYKRS